MKVVVAVSSITSVIMILFLSSFSASNIIRVQGQSLPSCPVGYQGSASGCIPATGSSFLNPYGYPKTTANPSAPQTTFNQPPSST
jgi:hypothetical protein